MVGSSTWGLRHVRQKLSHWAKPQPNTAFNKLSQNRTLNRQTGFGARPLIHPFANCGCGSSFYQPIKGKYIISSQWLLTGDFISEKGSVYTRETDKWWELGLQDQGGWCSRFPGTPLTNSLVMSVFLSPEPWGEKSNHSAPALLSRKQELLLFKWLPKTPEESQLL